MNDEPISDIDSNAGVGYRRPPKDKQFARGKSGNPRGRPVKQQRAAIPRQLRQDILTACERSVTIRTLDGERQVAAIEAVVMALLKAAASGNVRAICHVLKIHAAALQGHFDAHPPFALLEHMEKQAVLSDEVSPAEQRRINQYRRATLKA